ncbi:hypothetical protein ACH3O9_11330 [Leeuwenhoekiella sp. A16]|uniref:hypothetical protein n=1 Tax=Leeuwenhoekiella sp. A16 TaxID=3141462 RepID=UPI003A7F854D
MNDLEKFIALYKSFGISLEVEKNDKGCFVSLEVDDDNPKLTGYHGFYSKVYFDINGKFEAQCFAE